MRLGGQLRIASGMRARVIGWDFTAAFALGEALGIEKLAIAEFLPDLEAVAVRKMNERMQDGDEA